MNKSEDGPKTSRDDPWDARFRYLTEGRLMPNFKRGVVRQMQMYDPYVKTALEHFDDGLRKSLKGYTRRPGDEYAMLASLKKYDTPAYTKPAQYNTDKRFATCYDAAFAQVSKDFRLQHKVIPTFVESVDLVEDTSSGYPHFTRKSSIKETILKEARTYFHYAKEGINHTPFLPCSVGVRGALSDADNPKTRLVWMYPAAITASEAVFAQPLIEKYYSEKADLFLTGTNARSRLANLASHIDDDANIGVGLDFSSFDTFPVNDLIRKAFAILAENIEFGYYWDPETGTQIAGTTDSRDFNRVKRRAEIAYSTLIEYFIHTPLLLPNGRTVYKHHGVPSGSHFTNLIDSIVNRLLIKTFELYTNRRFKHLMTNGDDSAFLVHHEKAENILEDANVFFLHCFKMLVKPEKSVVADLASDMHMSGTRWNQALPYRPTQEWFQMALYPTTFVTDEMLAFQRLLGIGIAGAFRDPTYCRFFDFFQSAYDCRKDKMLNWRRFKWLEYGFGIEDLPKVYKQKSRLAQKLRTLLFNP
ncbi:RNA-dependent RNA polymerase [Fusarium cerealis partitivirus 1]|nr:RNA-dependent RNA polymerase [Fusarium cerealis partitivirus 1]